MWRIDCFLLLTYGFNEKTRNSQMDVLLNVEVYVTCFVKTRFSFAIFVKTSLKTLMVFPKEAMLFRSCNGWFWCFWPVSSTLTQQSRKIIYFVLKCYLYHHHCQRRSKLAVYASSEYPRPCDIIVRERWPEILRWSYSQADLIISITSEVSPVLHRRA